MKPILVVAATTNELALLIDNISETVGNNRLHEMHEGRIGSRRIILAETGIGKVNAAVVASRLIDRYDPVLIVNTGCAGAYSGKGLSIGDLALATAEIAGDDGVETPSGWQPMDLIGIPVVMRLGKSYFNKFPMSAWAAEKAAQLAASHGIPLCRGNFITVSTCSGSSFRGKEILRRFDGICENMEGAAVAQVALMHGTDCMEIRGISNMVEDRDLSRWNIPLANERAQRLVLKFLEEFTEA